MISKNLSNQIININNLPEHIRSKLPFSILTFKDEYHLSELPFDIQYDIKDYLTTNNSISYSSVLDIVSEVSEYGDFKIVSNIYDLVCLYIKNYLMIQEETYPHDPYFGSKLKEQLQTKDTKLKNTFINNEIDKIVNKVSDDLNINVSVEDIDIFNTSSTGMDVIYNINIKLNINEVEKNLKVSIDGE